MAWLLVAVPSWGRGPVEGDHDYALGGCSVTDTVRSALHGTVPEPPHRCECRGYSLGGTAVHFGVPSKRPRRYSACVSWN